MNQKFELLEIAIENDDMDLFFQGSGIYSFGDNAFYPVKRSVMADEALAVIYSYYKETLDESIVSEVEKCILELLSYKSGKGIYKAFEILACIMRSEQEGKSTFVCNTSDLRRNVENAVANNHETLQGIRENESVSIEGGMLELIHTENIYYYKKYGFLIIRSASETEVENIKKYISEEFGLRTPSLKRSISARTTGRAKWAIKKALIPSYGKKGMGWLKDPKKAAYNKVYNKTSFSITDLFKWGCIDWIYDKAIYEIESFEAKKRTYDSLVDYATIEITIKEVEQTKIAYEEKTVWQKIGAGFVDNLNGVTNFLVECFIFLISSIPCLALMAIVTFLFIVIFKMFFKKKKNKKKQSKQE